MLSLSTYTIGREIQRGASAVLLAGQRNEDQLPVILKTPRSELPTPRQIAKLRHELAILKDLPIDGVLKVHGLEVGEAGAAGEGNVALVFEGFDGQPLNDAARARRFDVEAILRIGMS